MARKSFFSFHYKPDNWRAAQVRQIGALEGNTPVSDNDWETVTKGGDAAIKAWITNQLKGCSCLVVLIGENTAGRKWISHEIEEAWVGKMGVVGIHIHGLKGVDGKQSSKGSNPFDSITVGGNKLSSMAKVYDTPYTMSTNVYDHIKDNLAAWVEEAITIRGQS